MNREWVSGNRLSEEYEKGIMDFCAFASSYASRNNIERVFCLCMSCWNFKKVKPKKLRKHLLLKGINPRYRVWYLHGEIEEQNIESTPAESFPEDNDDCEEDNLIEMVNNVANDFVDTPQVLESLRNDSELPLYEGCSKYTRLSATLKLFNLKAKNGWSNKSFTELLALLKDENTVVQNSGVTLVAETTHVYSARDRNPICVPVNYFGFIQEIWELDYVKFKVPVFKCKWVHNSAVHTDEFGMRFVDFRRVGYKDEPFIMAEQARQVFYVKDPSNINQYVVINGKQQVISGTSEEMAEDCIPVCTTVPVDNHDIEVDDEIQIREDHGEGIWIEKET